MNNFRQKVNKLPLLLGDIALLYLSLLLTLAIRYKEGLSLEIWQVHWTIFTGLFFIWLIVFYSFDLYNFKNKPLLIDSLNDYLPAGIINIIIGIVYFYILSPSTNITPKTILLILFAIFSFLFLIFRRFAGKVTSAEKFYPNLLFIGYQPLVKELLPKKGRDNRFYFKYKGIVRLDNNLDPEINLPQYSFDEIEEVIRKENINLVVINEKNQIITDALFKILPLRVNFISLANFYELVCKKIPLSLINRDWFLDNFSEGDRKSYKAVKRFIDLVIACLMGLVSLIFIPFITLAVKLDSKGKIFFIQKRIGEDGKIFKAYKFRTMYEGNNQTWTVKNDPRITKVGKFLRKTRLDEIPQIINVIKGDMSLVGPRPERPELVMELEKDVPFYRQRLLVKPGLTGWDQISDEYHSPSKEDTLKKLQNDLYYIKNRSIFFDLSIILKTINIIFKLIGR